MLFGGVGVMFVFLLLLFLMFVVFWGLLVGCCVVVWVFVVLGVVESVVLVWYFGILLVFGLCIVVILGVY